MDCFGRIGFNFKFVEKLNLNLNAFQRKIRNAIAFRPVILPNGNSAIGISNVGDVSVFGINGDAAVRWNRFEALGVMTLTRYKEGDTVC